MKRRGALALILAGALMTGVTAASPAAGAGSRPSCFGRLATIWDAQYTNGTSGNDVIVGTPDGDYISGGKGNDRICAKGGDDGVYGRGGKDRLGGGTGYDIGGGGPGYDRCYSMEIDSGCEG